MLRQCRWVAVAALLLSCSVAFAQQRPGGGGFGGGFGGGMNSPFMLVAIAEVQKELNLTDEQVGDLKTLGDELREEMRPLFAGGFGGRDQSEEERAKQREKMAESMKKVNDKFQPKLDKILEAAQRDRLKQIQIQADGSRAYQNADVVDALKISKEQQDKLAAISKEFGDKQRELFTRGGQGGGARPSPEEIEKGQKQRQELSDARDKQLAEVLTADQKSAFEKLKGKPFADLDKLRQGFGGGRGAPGGGGIGGANPGGRPQRRPQQGDKKSDEKKSE